MGVYLGGRDIRMTQHLLDATKIGASGKQMRREAVPQRMRRHYLVYACLASAAHEHPVNTLTGEAVTETIEEQMVGPGTFAEKLPTLFQVSPDSGERRLTHRD